MALIAHKLSVLYLDDHLVVLDKPAGMLSVPGRGPQHQDALSQRVQQVFPEALVVHRLDMGTSGLLVMARTPQAQSALSISFAQRRVHKGYVAIVQGLLAANAGHTWQCIDAPLVVDWPNRPRSKIDWQHGKPSQTRWRVIAEPDGHPALRNGFFRPKAPHTLVELEPITGRSHQLRVHLQSLGHPVAGDALYGDAFNQGMAARLLLHAWALTLPHPATGEEISWLCPAGFACSTP